MTTFSLTAWPFGSLKASTASSIWFPVDYYIFSSSFLLAFYRWEPSEFNNFLCALTTFGSSRLPIAPLTSCVAPGLCLSKTADQVWSMPTAGTTTDLFRFWEHLNKPFYETCLEIALAKKRLTVVYWKPCQPLNSWPALLSAQKTEISSRFHRQKQAWSSKTPPYLITNSLKTLQCLFQRAVTVYFVNFLYTKIKERV